VVEKFHKKFHNAIVLIKTAVNILSLIITVWEDDCRRLHQKGGNETTELQHNLLCRMQHAVLGKKVEVGGMWLEKLLPYLMIQSALQYVKAREMFAF